MELLLNRRFILCLVQTTVKHFGKQSLKELKKICVLERTVKVSGNPVNSVDVSETTDLIG